MHRESQVQITRYTNTVCAAQMWVGDVDLTMFNQQRLVLEAGGGGSYNRIQGLERWYYRG